ncbi:MAG: hypothetical protein WBM69_10165 [Desulfobacterales bacterium]
MSRLITPLSLRAGVFCFRNHNINNLLVGLIALSFICCSSPPPPKDEYQASIDEWDRILEQQEKQSEKTVEAVDKSLKNLREECFALKVHKTFISDSWQKYKQDELDFLTQLNQSQQECYSEWYESLKEDNQSKQMLYTHKLTNSLDEKQRPLLGNLITKRLEHVELATDFRKRSDAFQNWKNTLLIYLRVMVDDPVLYESMKLSIENELAY